MTIGVIMDKKLEARIARLEKLMRYIKNESSMDISADIYQWFNKHCLDILNADKEDGLYNLKCDLEDADISMLTDEAMDTLVADYGWSFNNIEDYREQIEYDIEKLVNDALNYIEHGDTSWVSFEPSKADWMDRYRDNDEYSASLESRVYRLESKVKNRMSRKGL